MKIDLKLTLTLSINISFSRIENKGSRYCECNSITTGIYSRTPNNGISEVSLPIKPIYNEVRDVDIPRSKDPLKSSPIMAGIDASLKSLNKEFSPEWNSKDVVQREGLTNFNTSSVNRMEIVGNLKVGQIIPDQSA